MGRSDGDALPLSVGAVLGHGENWPYAKRGKEPGANCISYLKLSVAFGLELLLLLQTCCAAGGSAFGM